MVSADSMWTNALHVFHVIGPSRCFQWRRHQKRCWNVAINKAVSWLLSVTVAPCYNPHSYDTQRCDIHCCDSHFTTPAGTTSTFTTPTLTTHTVMTYVHCYHTHYYTKHYCHRLARLSICGALGTHKAIAWPIVQGVAIQAKPTDCDTHTSAATAASQLPITWPVAMYLYMWIHMTVPCKT